jgi:carbon-monoxide dehydrogenase medium subunit
MTTLAALEHSEIVRRGWPAIPRALRTLANVRVRNVARIGGSLAHADPHMDLPPLLAALGASVTIAGPAGERTLPAIEVSTGYLETSLKRNELITRVDVPALAGRRVAYVKATTRSADDWPAVGIAVSFALKEKNFDAATFVVSAATDRPMRLSAAESMLQGGPLDDGKLKQACEATAAALQIESDLHGSAAYKKQLVRVYLGRAIRQAWQQP